MILLNTKLPSPSIIEILPFAGCSSIVLRSSEPTSPSFSIKTDFTDLSPAPTSPKSKGFDGDKTFSLGDGITLNLISTDTHDFFRYDLLLTLKGNACLQEDHGE